MKILKSIGWAIATVVFIAACFMYYLVSAMSGEQQQWQPGIAAAPALSAKLAAPCSDNNPLRNAYFGDLHVHTAYSWDGSGRGMHTTPAQAYQFASGESIALPPYNVHGEGLRNVRLERPLDFAAVTDHAESIGEVKLCSTPGSRQYNNEACRAFRGEERYGFMPKMLSPMAAIRGNSRSENLCGPDGAICREATKDAWQTMQQAAEEWYDRSPDCRFTTFHGYEYTWAPAVNRVHRNVIFRNEVVPELPISTADAHTPEALWAQLKKLCLDSNGDCDALAIPHNPNHASGRMFPLSDSSQSLEQRRAAAQVKADMEPLMEMMQIKGESECRNDLWGVTGAPDEYCNLEKWDPLENASDCEDGTGIGKSLGLGCVARTDHARYAIAAGIQEQKELGVNPYKLGFIGSTDTHNGTPGAVDEWAWQGSTGMQDHKAEQRLKAPAKRNPGGLVGVWSEENSRDALFNAMRKREVFATSGTRMTVRLFGGWDDFSGRQDQGVDTDGSDSAWCDRPDALAAAYSTGVPMGSDLRAESSGKGAPYFAINAKRDPGTDAHPGNLLQRVQVIKVQVNPDGSYQQDVFDVAGGANDARVDMNTCEPIGKGANEFCTVWRDPKFDPNEAVAYYARVIENPSCRWTTWTCLSLPESERPAACDDIAETTQERAWSSPIWYAPQ